MIADDLAWMTPKEKFLRMAELCGWVLHPKESPWGGYRWYHNNVPVWCEAPDYLNDLNAMREAVTKLPDTVRASYAYFLRLVTLGKETIAEQMTAEQEFQLLNATAAQRLDAFLLTVSDPPQESPCLTRLRMFILPNASSTRNITMKSSTSCVSNKDITAAVGLVLVLIGIFSFNVVIAAGLAVMVVGAFLPDILRDEQPKPVRDSVAEREADIESFAQSLNRPNITVADGNRIIDVDRMPDTRTGFISFQGELREIRDIHQTSNGTQIELIPGNPYIL